MRYVALRERKFRKFLFSGQGWGDGRHGWCEHHVVHEGNAGEGREEVGHQERESGRALQSAGRTGACGHGRWGRDAAAPLGREVRGLEGRIR
jgi:hypothetical protein